MKQRISETLEFRGGQADCRICCGKCGHALALAGQSWKPHAALSTVPVRDLPGAASAVHRDIVFRRFCCPACGTLLDCETALPEDPFLDDVVAAPRFTPRE
jgi:acetone carboxylase gamma subunit